MPFNSFENYPMTWRPALSRMDRPLYQALAALLEKDILEGRLRPGTKLPPQRELADFLDINVSTVTKALRLCAEKGLLSGMVGSGTFVSYDALSSGRLVAPYAPHIINMGATVPESDSYGLLMDELHRMLQETDADRWFCHHAEDDPQWYWQKDAARQLLKACGIEAPAHRILFSSGGQNGLTAILAALFHPGDTIAVEDHTYPGIKTAAAMFGIHLIPVSSGPDGLDWKALRKLQMTERIKAIYLISTCQNPTTNTMSLSARQEAARCIDEQGLWLIEDGTYQLTETSLPAISGLIPDRTIFITSLSKIIAPGLRMGILTAPDAYFSAIADALYSLNVSVTPLMEELAARIIASGKYLDILAMHKEKTRHRNRVIRNYFNPQECAGKDTDIFRWLYLPAPWTGDAFADCALKEGVRVYSASKFAVGRTKPAAAVRLSIASPQAEAELETGLQILRKLYDQYSASCHR